MTMTTLRFKVQGMRCAGCEMAIENALSQLPGVAQAKADHARQTVEACWDEDLTQLPGICRAIEDLGYACEAAPTRRPSSFLVFLLFLAAIGGVALWGKSLMPGMMRQLDANLSHAVLFGLGLLTGFHCIGMCGGFVIGYASRADTPLKMLGAHLAYGIGKTFSYSLIGAGFGLLGASIAITPQMRGVAALAASIFMLLYGLKMLDLTPRLRYFALRWPQAAMRGVAGALRACRKPLSIGLLTGLLLGCGPLQALYVMAAGVGDPLQGASLLFFFGLGTLPPLLGFGVFANLMSRSLMRELARASGALVLAMGLMMADRGLKMTHSGYDFAALAGHAHAWLEAWLGAAS
jgi:sulfite exporter TauE/SafE/copper chaperone CopZ